MLTFEGVQAQGTAAIIEKLQVCNIFSKFVFKEILHSNWGSGHVYHNSP